MPVNGLTNSAQPVLGITTEPGSIKGVQKAIVFMSVVCILYTVSGMGIRGLVSGVLYPHLQPGGRHGGRREFRLYACISLDFHDVPSVCGPVRVCGPGKIQKRGIFSIFRKVIIVIPLIIILPTVFGMGTQGILMAEPISNFIRGRRLLQDHAAHCVA